MIASRVSALKYRSSEYKMNRWFRCIFWIILTYVLAYFWMFWPLFHAPHSSSWPEPGNQNAANIVLPSTTSFDALRRRVRRMLFWKVDHHDFSWYFLLSTFEIGGHFKSNAVSHFTTLSTLPWTWWAHLRSPIDLMLSRIQVLNAATYEANTDFRRTVMSVLWHHRFRNGRSAELSLSLSSQTQTNLTICNAGWLRWALLEVRWTVHWTVCATWPVTLRLPATRSEFTAWPWQQVRLRCGGQMSSADALAVY